MTYQAKQIGEIKDFGKIFQVAAPLSKQIKAFQEQGIAHPYLVNPEQTARIRIVGISNDWTRTSMAPVGVKGEKPILYKSSPLMDPHLAVVAEQAHKNGEYPTMPREFYVALSEEAKKQEGIEPEDRSVHMLSSSEDFDLTHEMDDTRFILGSEAKEYLERFNHSGIRLFNLPTKDLSKDECNVNYLWFDSPELDSFLSCGDRNLDDDDRAFGVFGKSAEGASQKLEGQVKPYTAAELRDVKNNLDQIMSTLGIR